MAQYAEGPPAAPPVDFQLRFDFRFEDFQVLMDAAGGHAAKFAVDQCHVGKNGQCNRHKHDTQRIQPAVIHRASPSRFRSFRSIRSISP